jgi:hypothetical protein
VLRSAAPGFDAGGRPILRIQKGDEVVNVGVAGSNLMTNDAAERFTQGLLEARLRAELRRGASPKVSERDVARDWNLLQKALNGTETQASARGTLQTGSTTGNRR